MARLTPAERRLRSQISSHTKWEQCEDPTAATAPARNAFDKRFYEGLEGLPEAERERRAGHRRKAYFAKLALASSKARRAKKSVNATKAGPNNRLSSKSESPSDVRSA
jgi:hypothetical protein